MPDAKIVKRWKITETLLERARRALPARDERQYAALLSRYCEYMEHNELELALDILEELGHLVSACGGFWRDLERAAENMGLAERLPAFRKAFSEAPGSALVDGSPADPMPDYSAMTVNERLFVANLVGHFDAAVRSRDKAKIAEILLAVQLTPDQANETATAVLADPGRYGLF